MEKQDWLEIINIMGKKDLLDIADIVIIPIILALLALLWPAIQNCYRRRIFTKLMIRELSEISPYPNKAKSKGCKKWHNHCKKTFIHQKIFKQPHENRDFILSLDPDLVYYISQLWDSLEKKDATQWWYCLQELTLFIEYYCLIEFEFSRNFPFIKMYNYSKKYKNNMHDIYIKWFNIFKGYEHKVDFYINRKNVKLRQKKEIVFFKQKLRQKRKELKQKAKNNS